jgi:hypothetical protein
MDYVGNFGEDATVYLWFTTTLNGALAAPSDDFEAADLAIRHTVGTAKATTNGITVTTNVGGLIGLHVAAVDTSNDTGDAGYWTVSRDYMAVLNPDTETVAGFEVVGGPWQWSIENRATSGAAPSAAVVADAVWDEARGDHVGAGSFGQGVASVQGDVTGNVDGNVGGNVVGSVASVTGNVDGNVTGSVASVTGNVDGNVTGSVASVAGNVDGNVSGNVAGNVVGSVASVTGNVDGNVTGSVGSVTGNVDGNVTGSVGSVAGNVAGSVASVTGNVDGNVTGSVGSVTGNVTGSVGSVTGNVDGNVTGSVGSLVGHTVQTGDSFALIGAAGAGLTAVPWNSLWDPEVQSEVEDALDVTIADSIPADGTVPSVRQALYMITQFLLERAVSGTTVTVRKADGSTTLLTCTLDDATSPTSITRAT